MALIEKLENIANAIRSKTNKSEGLTLEQMASAIEELKVEELDFKDVFNQEQADEINQYYKDGIAYAKKIKAENPNPSGSWENKFIYNPDIIYMPKFDYSQVANFKQTWRDVRNLQFFFNERFFNEKANNFSYVCYNCGALKQMPQEMELTKAEDFSYAWYNCLALRKMSKTFIAPNATTYSNAWNGCFYLEEMPDMLDTSNVTSLASAWYNCGRLKKIILSSVAKCTNFTNAFLSYNQLSLQVVHFSEWKSIDISITHPYLQPESIHYIIQNAMNVADGATARRLTLSAAAKTNWQNSEYYEEDLAALADKGITIA